MSSPATTSHMPALKVGGRRLSVSNRPKHTRSASKDVSSSGVDAAAAPKEGEAQGNAENANNNNEEGEQQEDEQAKREKKRQDFTPEHSIKRDGRWIDNTPKNRKNNAYGGAGRISQPAGKTVPS
ncbi:hypothetical protein FRC15_004706 [Serendipita sp. 397]|nr:hypothetical protein FRC15_004706 [Serendipita sp. 397]KAG8779422.1 hypothetical protein FRC16_003432 [Serendipita sp. 398]